MTYYIKLGEDKLKHIFNEDTCACGSRLRKLKVVCDGLIVRKVTCMKCKRAIPEIVNRELGAIMREMLAKKGA